MGRFAAFVVMVAIGLGLGVWYARGVKRPVSVPIVRSAAPNPDAWIETLQSRNPREAADAARQLTERGAAAIPAIRAALQNLAADRAHRKAALKAVGLLGTTAAPLLDDVVPQLADPEMTAEAAVALSFMGPSAFTPLRDALDSQDPAVRREALRSIGKLRDRAGLDTHAVVPLLVARSSDPDAGVRSVAATYLGIIHEGGGPAVAALVSGLADPEADVRRASAAALGSFPSAAKQALPALKRAATDADEDVAREAGLAIVKLQGR